MSLSLLSTKGSAKATGPGRHTFKNAPRVLVIGAGSRGSAYAVGTLRATNCRISAVCEPVPYKRSEFGRKYIWGTDKPNHGEQFEHWRHWVEYEESRRFREAAGEKVEKGVDAVFVCVLDELHEEVVCGIAGLGVHICCEKPMSTSLESCMNIWRALKGIGVEAENGEVKQKESIFAICHVLRYSPHNLMLRQLVLEKEVIGDVLSIEHVEPVGNWHFSHSYVRGNWRKESTTAPSLLTKSCHDIDFLMWMLCSPPPSKTEPHLPSFVTSTGSRKFFRKARKPEAAKEATNCLSCPHEEKCDYSAKWIYLDNNLNLGNTSWPVKVINPEIEQLYKTSGKQAAAKQLLSDLREDYTSETAVEEVEARAWYGRCVYEADNDVVDDQCVTITWDDDPLPQDGDSSLGLKGRGAKTAQFHMVAFTEKVCQRRGRIYGTKGEIEYDGKTIKVYSFSTRKTNVYTPQTASGGHGGGDQELARQFLMAVEAVDSQGMSAADAHGKFLGCDLDEAFRSHAMVFAAEEARKDRKVVDWKKWWSAEVEGQLHSTSGKGQQKG
ncbi:streptomycin biosynthesis protein StrI [Pleomassaria siparia CBS 279.74]|uniref:Streptomycin biosynthesis protein StrI n=1 Tax=Pleomassaria siparia CBS 279.74 TaxID=1314801 RepID=A0A6G1KHG6_9PLEO|nr:streptomycin biosynthesis protein StrI [Pleomassaria siparia CBS 279.74]